ncbi:MAG TPA: CAP domain-containing protein [Candidatus Elarobacter sp.]|nr:CAP domain-containing protein [Candidatus Elarobacter sp.]
MKSIIVGLAAGLIGISALNAHAPSAGAQSQIVSGDVPIKIAFVNPHPHSLPRDAQALADNVNTLRAQHRLPALRRDATLDRIAYAKAVDMAARGYFGHTDPNGITFADRMHAWHLNVYGSENIAFDASESAAQTDFLHSPEHYASEVDPRVRQIGVAVVTVGQGQTFYVEDFSG